MEINLASLSVYFEALDKRKQQLVAKLAPPSFLGLLAFGHHHALSSLVYFESMNGVAIHNSGQVQNNSANANQHGDSSRVRPLSKVLLFLE